MPLNRARPARRNRVFPPVTPYCCAEAVAVVVVEVVVWEWGIWDDNIGWGNCGVLLWSGAGVILSLIEDVLAVAAEVVVSGDDERSWVAVSVAASLAKLWDMCLPPTIPRALSNAVVANVFMVDRLSEVKSLTCELEMLLLVLPLRLYLFRGPSLTTELSEL